MNSTQNDDRDRLTDVAKRMIQSWENGAPIPMAELAREFATLLADADTVLELLELDNQMRRERSQPSIFSDYLAAFPAFRTEIDEFIRAKELALTPPETCSLAGTIDSPGLNARETTQRELVKPDKIGRYRIQEMIETGSFGSVFLGRDAELGRDVAVKVLHHIPDSSQPKEKLRKEAKNLAALRHPSLLSVYDFGVDETGCAFVVTEYLSGPSLKQRLEQRDIRKSEATKAICQVAEALHYAHRKGFIHRDVKPANVVFDDKDHAKLVDFGLVLLDDEQSRTRNQVAGTPAYMAPEQTEGRSHHLDGRCDIWALGVILYEIWSGQKPFRGATTTELFDAIQNREAKPLRMIGDVPPDIEAIISKCMAKAVADRYDSAEDVALALTQFLTQEESGDVPDSLSSSKSTPIPAKKETTALTGVCAVLVVVAVGAIWFFASEQNTGEGNQQEPPTVAGGDTEQLLDGDIFVSVWRNGDTTRNNIPIEAALPLQEGDAIRIDGRLTQPGYTYIVWISTDGVLPLYPWEPGEWSLTTTEERIQNVSLPSVASEGWPMETNPHMESIVMFVTDQPLSAGEVRTLLEGYPVPESASPFEVIRLDDKSPSTEEIDGQRQARLRAPRLDSVKLDDQVQLAKRFLKTRLRDKAELIRAKGFWSPPLNTP